MFARSIVCNMMCITDDVKILLSTSFIFRLTLSCTAIYLGMITSVFQISFQTSQTLSLTVSRVSHTKLQLGPDQNIICVIKLDFVR